ncbi:hypothetical protein ACIA03_28035 [Nocardioides sp. NPDC051685]|uniref:hypothetical protein n=1 Tax=Nocardioides sp. NPDC051685 TaxID=3364334 RepID=UPI0037B4CE58
MDPRELQPAELLGRVLIDVDSSWLLDHSTGVRELMDVWLTFEGLGQIRVHTLSGLRLHLGPPPDAFDMPDLECSYERGHLAPALVGELVGHRVIGVGLLAELAGEPFPPGMVLEFESAVLAFVDRGDDLAIGPWPDPDRWRGLSWAGDVRL